ncbi:MAG: hypothetical protein EA423_11605 [Phycisphaerales bacterium]|nr:MAG: hypothetical protein EA423_11605 [Phycisphaerales bacterium]
MRTTTTAWIMGLAIGCSAAVADRTPTLDELLGLETREQTEARETTPDDVDRRLAEQLEGGVRDLFEQVTRLMGETAERMRASRDTGLPTQRMQREVLEKLDQLIEAAGRQQQQSSSSSSSSSDDAQGAEQQSQQQQQAAGEGAEGDQEATPPSSTDEVLNPLAATGEAAWGALPERVREAISQGTSDPFSTMYRSMTEAYYKRLAEDGRD